MAGSSPVTLCNRAWQVQLSRRPPGKRVECLALQRRVGSFYGYICVLHICSKHSTIEFSNFCSHKSSHCVGTRRPAALSQKQIQHLVRPIGRNKLSNFEMRMVAEVELYWLIYQMSSASPNGVSRTDHRLIAWRDEHTHLFGM